MHDIVHDELLLYHQNSFLLQMNIHKKDIDEEMHVNDVQMQKTHDSEYEIILWQEL